MIFKVECIGNIQSPASQLHCPSHLFLPYDEVPVVNPPGLVDDWDVNHQLGSMGFIFATETHTTDKCHAICIITTHLCDIHMSKIAKF